MKILFATTNPAKVKTYASRLIEKGYEIVTLKDLKIDGYLDEDLIGLSVYVKDKLIGKVTDIIKNSKYSILVITDKNMVPNLPEFIEKVDIDKHKIIIKEIEGLINEN